MSEQPRAKVRVRVEIVVEVDRDAYEAEYGESATPLAIREHIRGEVFAAAVSAFENLPAIEVVS